jgi:hypothetical protein
MGISYLFHKTISLLSDFILPIKADLVFKGTHTQSQRLL